MMDMVARRSFRSISLCLICVGLAVTVAGASPAGGKNWPSFRGAQALGVAEGFPTPTTWDVKTGENVLWKTPIPGLAHSSPVIWGDRIFVTTAAKREGDSRLKVGLYGDIKSEKEDTVFDWRLYCIDRKTGDVQWFRDCHSGKPKVKRHAKSSHANATVCTNGKVVVAFFGAEGLHCFDMAGQFRWQKDLGVLDWGYYRSPAAQWGGGSSPVIHEDKVILQCDVQKDSFLAAYSLKDGTEIWRTPREEVPTWGTPTVHPGPKHAQIIVNGYKHIGGYAIDSGRVIWKMTGGGDIPVPTPIVADDLVYITNAHGRMSPIYAVKLSAAGVISLDPGQTSNEFVAWSHPKGGNYMTTPILYKGYLYCCSNSGKLSCLDPVTGEMMYKEGLGKSSVPSSASPVAADGKLYFSGERGNIYVVEAGPEFKVVAVNDMDETCMATPAVSHGTLFFRTRHHLVAVAEVKK